MTSKSYKPPTLPIRLVREEMVSENACIDFLLETLRVLLEQLIVGKPYNYSRYSLSLITFFFFRISCQKKLHLLDRLLYRLLSTCVISTTTNWVGYSTTPSLWISLSCRFSASSWVLLLLPTSARI